ncbi:hypothetical protein HII31_06596 [Pseudocercospora fuligena]|uniref:F-box domain-containing protein n=1 Tax=Pseudocercospora fuligena TaxID=685502 RepID=A0A8H6RJ24_9PEZI|nr:hypothetical protein HII31_06596 [Pseudocercospora fuligena]
MHCLQTIEGAQADRIPSKSPKQGQHSLSDNLKGMARPKRKGVATRDSAQNKAPKRAPNLEPGEVEKHMQVVNTSSQSRRAFTRSAKRKDIEAARNAVLNTEELLEAILSFLPAIDIIKCQRVAQYWRDTIKESAQIKQKLVIRCSDDSEQWTVQGGKIVATDQTADVLRDNFDIDNTWVDVMAVTSSLNPLVSSYSPLEPQTRLQSDETYGIRNRTNLQLSRDFQKGFIQLLRGQSSPMLEAMLIHNLPVTELAIHFRAATAGGLKMNRPLSYMKLSGPLTVGRLAKEVGRLGGCRTSFESSSGRMTHIEGFGDTASHVRSIESWSGQKLEMLSMQISIFGVLFASAEDREAVRAGKGVPVSEI